MLSPHPAVSLLLVSGLTIYWLIPLTAWFMLRGEVDRRSNIWFGAATLYAAGLTLFVLRGSLPALLTGPLGLTLIVCALLGFAEALHREESTQPAPWLAYALVAATILATHSGLMVVGSWGPLGLPFHHAVLAPIDAWVAWSAVRIARRRHSRGLWIVATVFLLFACNSLVRAAEFTTTGHFSDILSFSRIGNASLLLNYVGGVFYSFGYWGFVLEKQRARMTQATEATVAARERERMATEREQLTERMSTISRMAQAGAISAAIAHEINQPLTAIQLDVEQVQALLQDTQLDAGLQAPLERIGRNVVRTSEIVHRLRQLLTPRGGSDTLERPDDVVRMVVDLLKPRLPPGWVELALDGGRDAHISAGELEHVVLNLVHNALDSFATAATRSPRLHVQTWMTESHFHLACTDNGPGVPPDVRNGIFEMHFSTKRDHMGMGLWLSRIIAERHGGKLYLDETWLGGSRFLLSIPAG